MCVQFPAFQRKSRAARDRAGIDWGRPKQRAIDPAKQTGKITFVRRADDNHTRTLGRRKAPVIEVVAIERHESTSELAREAIVFDVPCATQLVMLEHEQHIPFQPGAHEAYEPGGHIGICVHSRSRGKALSVWAQLRCEGSHVIYRLRAASEGRRAASQISLN